MPEIPKPSDLPAAKNGSDPENPEPEEPAADNPELEDTEAADDPEGGNEPGEDPDDGDPGALGDKGKKALDSMKVKLRAERKNARDAKRELAEMKRQREAADKPEAEQEIEAARAEARAEATEAANRRIRRSEAKAAATGKLAHPELITKLADLEDIEVDDDGNVDQDALNDAIEQVLESYPSLAAQRSTGKFDSARGKKRPQQKYTRDEIKSWTPAQIAKAYDDGLIEL